MPPLISSPTRSRPPSSAVISDAPPWNTIRHGMAVLSVTSAVRFLQSRSHLDVVDSEW